MANMSYCRFHNTYNDLQDCKEALDNGDISSESEKKKAKALVELCKEYAKESGSTIVISEDINVVKGADALYTDVWCSMGEEDKAAERIKLLSPYQVNEELFKLTGNDKAILLHCLPAVKGKEVTEDVFEKNADVIFDEAENRMHTIKAVMVATIGNI